APVPSLSVYRSTPSWLLRASRRTPEIPRPSGSRTRPERVDVIWAFADGVSREPANKAASASTVVILEASKSSVGRIFSVEASQVQFMNKALTEEREFDNRSGCSHFKIFLPSSLAGRLGSGYSWNRGRDG